MGMVILRKCKTTWTIPFLNDNKRIKKPLEIGTYEN